MIKTLTKKISYILGTIGLVLAITACSDDSTSTYNATPSANAGVDQHTKPDVLVELDGSLSSDPDSDILTYNWNLVSQPVNSNIGLSSTAFVNPTFTPIQDGEYIFSLSVNDGVNNSLPDDVTITVETANSAPVANAGTNQHIKTDTVIELDASQSSDADLDVLTYTWSIANKPEGSSIALSNTSIVNPIFTPDVDGLYKFSLVVNDGTVDSAEDTVSITATTENSAPVANAGTNKRNVATPTLVRLNASLSSDADSDTLTYTWSIGYKPPGSTITLSSTTTQNPEFTPDVDGAYVFALVVNDGTVDSSRDVVMIQSVTYGTVTSESTNRTWLDRNLGASQVCAALDDKACYGDYYQWGRLADGHEKSDSPTSKTPATSITAPDGSFIIYPEDWTTGDNDGALRIQEWSKTDGTSICPQGYRVPTKLEIGLETTYNTIVEVTNNSTAFENFLKLPSAGHRSGLDGQLELANTGNLWVNDRTNNLSENLYFNSTNAQVINSSSTRGYPVRCIKN